MNPLFEKIVGSFIRQGLAIGGGLLVQHGLLTDDAAIQLTAGLTTLLVSVAWSVYEKYGSRRKLVTAMALPPTNEKTVEMVIRDGESPPASLSKTIIPFLKVPAP